MNTPAHLLFGAAVAASGPRKPYVLWAFAGALLPDLSLYVLAGVSLFVLQLPPERVFGELYFSDDWQLVFAIDNSFVLWGALFAIALWRGWTGVLVLSGAALLHVALDFPLHHDDGRPHFWPLTRWVYESPISYWDHRQGAAWVSIVTAAVSAASAAALWMRYPGWRLRAFVAVLLAAELWTVRQWLLFF